MLPATVRRLLTGPVLVAAIGVGTVVAPAPARAAGVAATILVNGTLAVRSGPSNAFAIVGSLRDQARVRIDCAVAGRLTKGSVRTTTTWDRLTGGGYVSHGYVLTSGTLPRCAPALTAPVRPPETGATTVVVGTVTSNDGPVDLHSGPATTSDALGAAANGSTVSLVCGVVGQLVTGSVRSSTQWNRLADGRYIPHAYVVTPTVRLCPDARSTPPATTPPVTKPPTVPPATTAPPAQACVTDELLVPSCGVLWGAAAGGFTSTPRDQALKEWERKTGRTATIFHQYHKGDEKFPTKAEIAMTRDPGNPRVLLLNWKVAYNTTWAKVAAGQHDARINAWADYVKATYNDKFFLALHHEPENDISTNVSSGMTAKDYAAMYRHVVTLLRAKGVHNAINVVAYMGNEKWMAQSWWNDIYPGDDYVDWIGLDSYVSVEKGAYHYGTFGDLINRRPTGGGTSWIDWATTAHPTKPVMIAEWGMYHRTSVTVDKSAAFDTVLPELKAHPQIKAIVYFDTKADDEGDRDISIDSTPAGLAAFKKLAANPLFKVKLG
jgi:beta-mannanase/uncharacterized protein YraI